MHKGIWRISAVSVFLAVVLCFSAAAFAEEADTSVLLNGRRISFDNEPIVIDGTTLVEVRPLAEALDASVKWVSNTQSVKLTTKKVSVVLKMDYDIMTLSNLGDSDDLEQIQLSEAPQLIDDVAYVPVRNVAEALGAKLEWDGDAGEILLSTGGYKYSASSPAAVQRTSFKDDFGHTFFFQNQSDWQLPNFGSGYCWTCSYAMLISDVTGETVTPNDVAEVNEARGGSGAYCFHWDIIDAFGVKFVSALDEDSSYYGGRDSNSGGTYVENPDGDEEIAVEALKEAIDLHPEGVMVRYAAYPHTMVAVGYDGDTIYFNEPMQTVSGSYLDDSSKCCVSFEETCVGKRGISIADITFIQALEEA